MDLDIAEYLLSAFQTAPLTKRLLSDYKEGKAYSYFDSKWLDQVYYHPVSDDSSVCLLKSKSVPSQKINDICHRIWIAIEKKSGSIKSSYCTCFAGLGSTCNHVAAVLFKIDWAWKSGITNTSCTSKPCTWNQFGAKGKVLDLQPVSQLEWRKPHYSKGGDRTAINNTIRRNFQPSQTPQPPIASLTNAFFGSCSSGCIFQYVDLPTQHIPPEADVNVLEEVEVLSDDVPSPVPKLVQQGCNSWVFSDRQVLCLERQTRGQSSNNEWHEQKVGRITASNVHSVFTKVRHMERCFPKRLDCSSLLQKLCSRSRHLDHVPAIKYGQSMEAEARHHYFQTTKKGHQNLEVQECGLFVLQDKAYIGASPDALVSCSCCGQGLLEIKCPLTVAHVDPLKQPPPYIVTENGCYRLKKEHLYYSQVIAQMGVTGRKWCDFFVYSRHGTLTVRVQFDSSWWQSLVKTSDTFFFNHMINFITSK